MVLRNKVFILIMTRTMQPFLLEDLTRMLAMMILDNPFPSSVRSSL
ncbi:hypothetical protein F383_33036 [Gossypium arboreum]|uniref:Uncharacterized protein n=1 Tax=Gossypium arboreum TaxID=29729 RepID=A0A0B0PNU3_GOSAR|nr:hypothetical protein F383_33036 [Gossypium arboreum]